MRNRIHSRYSDNTSFLFCFSSAGAPFNRRPGASRIIRHYPFSTAGRNFRFVFPFREERCTVFTLYWDPRATVFFGERRRASCLIASSVKRGLFIRGGPVALSYRHRTFQDRVRKRISTGLKHSALKR